jgi:hypothetical protein
MGSKGERGCSNAMGYPLITKEKTIGYFGGMHNFRFEPMLFHMLAALNGLFIRSFGGRDLIEAGQRESQLVIGELDR